MSFDLKKPYSKKFIPVWDTIRKTAKEYADKVTKKGSVLIPLGRAGAKSTLTAFHVLAHMNYLIYMDEEILMTAKDSDLPLYINRAWGTDASKASYKKRLKSAKTGGAI